MQKKCKGRGWWAAVALTAIAAGCQSSSARDTSATPTVDDHGGADSSTLGGSDDTAESGATGGESGATDGESEASGGGDLSDAGGSSGNAGANDGWLVIGGATGSVEGGAAAVDCAHEDTPTGELTLSATIRDFRFSHPDFERGTIEAEEGLVEPTLGKDGKPVFSGVASKTVTGAETFNQWYRDVPGVNVPIHKELVLDGAEVHLFNSQAYFPIDGQGFGNEGNDSAGVSHNFAFTTEIHATFVYRGGERFTFSGDDDLWVFIAGRLVIDLGGVHSSLTKTLDLDAAADDLGLELGNSYPMDLFHAERQTTESNFGIRTDLRFTCNE